MSEKDRGQEIVCPIVHLNGTSREELIELRTEFVHALREAMLKLEAMSPNGRDYYLEPGRFDKARTQHVRRQKMLGDLKAEIAAEVDRLLDSE